MGTGYLGGRSKMPLLCLLSITIVGSVLNVSASDVQDNVERRKAYLETLETVSLKNETFDTWRERTGELPPDFDAMPSQALLPDPLKPNGKAISSTSEWEAERERLKGLFQKWIIGSIPPSPDNLKVDILAERVMEGATVREIELHFGKEHAAKLWMEVYIPKGEGPFPVFITQDNHRGWALIALRRGYLCCVYAGSDSRDDTGSFIEPYAEYDWSKLTRRAWAASRCIDYLETLPQVDTEKIAITGHSRNGKLSLIASAMDTRIDAVISSSSGVGGCMPSRYYGEPHFGEGIENITSSFPDWFHPRWRFFIGRENKMPVDLHQLIALSAPRPCLLSIAYADGVESAWAMEETYRSVQPVYDLYNAAEKLRILWRPAGHETWTTTIERYVDWCDTQFGRGEYSFPERLIYPHDWQAWKEHASALLTPDAFPERLFTKKLVVENSSPNVWEAQKRMLRRSVKNMLGTAPPVAPAPKATYGREPAHIARLFRRDSAGNRLEKDDLMFGEYINADVYMPEGTQEKGEKIPAILWLHPCSSPVGYIAPYHRGEQAFRPIARKGYAVFCYDQIGYGRRLEEIEGFYTRHPDWSVLGKMLRDAQSALDVMVELPYIDKEHIYVMGYNLGAFVALHLATLDDRPNGYALICPPPPFRLDTDTASTGGITRWSKLHMLLPQLGTFVGAENHIPYDINELMAAMAPRPVLVCSPTLDYASPLPAMQDCVASAQSAYALYHAEKQLTHEQPVAYNHFGPRMQRIVINWLKQFSDRK